MSEERLRLRVYPTASGPTLVYLPGLHGDWTLVDPFREALAGRATWVEMTYPRTVAWSLADYARRIGDGLEVEGIRSGWLLAESFGSQVAWAMLAAPAPGWRIEGLILAGGFVRYAPRWLARRGERTLHAVSARALQRALRIYARLVRLIRRRARRADLDEFLSRRTALDKAAAAHRLGLIAGSDWRPVAAAARLPVFHLTGLIDPVVCWWPVRRWLRRCCPGYRGSRLVVFSDHNVLGSAPRASADQVLGWIASAPRSP